MKQKKTISDIYTNGLNAAKTMLTNNDSNEVTITQSGIICRRMDDEGFYRSKQIRITGNIMAFTRDSWESVETAIGEVTFKDPSDPDNKKMITAYGLLAPAIVGKLIASEKMYIGNEKGSVQITGDGIKITNGTIAWGNGKNSVNAPEMGDIDGLKDSIDDLSDSLLGIRNNFTKFQTDVKAVLGLGSTTITSSTVIAPKIGGGYLFITNGRTANNNTGISVEINPNGTNFTGHKDGYVFSISKNKGTDLIMGVDDSGNRIFDGKVLAKSGNIGGWDINNNSLSYGSLSDAFILLDPINKSVISKYGSQKATLTSGYIGFEKNDVKYMTLHTTSWRSKPDIYGVGINSEPDSKFISFGNKESSTDQSYITPLVLNYGLDPDDDKQDVLIYGTTLITGETTIKNKLYLNSGTYLNGLTGGGIYCDGQFSTMGKVCVGNVDYGCMLNVNGTGYFSSNFTADGNVVAGGNITADGELISKGSYDNVGTNAPNVMIGGNAYHIRRTTGSSRRFKEFIKPIKSKELNPDRLYDVDVVQYKFKKDYLSKDDQRYDKEVIGFIAEDIYKKYPIAADYSIDEDGNIAVNDWNFRYMVPAMLKLLQEQKERIDSLENNLI